jgi:polysaccharide biosynthesis transport protein
VTASLPETRSDDSGGESVALVAYSRVLVRRKWLVLCPLILVPLAAVLVSLQQTSLYQASAQVLLSQQSPVTSILGISDASSALQPDRVAQTQADLARVPEVAQRTLAAAGMRNRSPLQFLADSSVSPTSNADLLEFDVQDRSPATARLLATEYARQFISYRNHLNASELQRARHRLEDRLKDLRAAGLKSSPLYADLTAKKQQLMGIEALQTTSAVLVRPADQALRVQPRPLRDGMLGLCLGLLLGIGAALLRERIDTRVRGSDEIERILDVPLLARLPSPPEDAVAALLRDPSEPYAESIRTLRVRLELTTHGPSALALMVTSALAREGKSTTVAGLSVALAQAGRKVVLCDLDPRRPALDRLFRVERQWGLIDVACGRASLDRALKKIAIPAPLRRRAGGSSNRRNGGSAGGLLEVLTFGHIPPDPSEFISSDAVAAILEQLRDRADFVLVDAPPLLGVGDAMALAAQVDGILLVSRLDLVRRATLGELRRVLRSCPAPTVGFVATAASVGDGYPYEKGEPRWGWLSPSRQQPVTPAGSQVARR